jgi:spore germination cell wall hydrolase CwlJ-like protein
MRKILVFLILGLLSVGGPKTNAGVAPRSPAGSYLQRAVAALLVAEAGCDKQPGMLGVAEVIRNRARTKGKTPIAIIKQPGVFSSLNDTDLGSLIHKNQDHPQFTAALRIANVLLQRPESLPNTTRNATHFDNVRNAPYWTHAAKVTVTIGNHRFYRTAY